jgi:membrane fusion protein, heavy metal efflux system
MRGSLANRISIGAVVLVAILLAALATTSACSRKEPPPEHKTAATAPKGETEEKGGHRKGVVELTKEALRTAGVEVREVVPVTPSELIGATAVLELNGDRVSRVNPRVTGRCVSVNASLGDRVRSGQTLAQIDSPEVDQAWSDYMKAKARLDLATRNVTREETLFQKKVSPEKDLLKARQELGEAEADMLLVREKFRLLGVDTGQVETNTNGTTHNHPLIPVPAPLSGVVVERSLTQGEMIGPEKMIFTIADLSTLWLMIDIYERDIGGIRTGMETKLSIAAYPGKEFRGRISYLGDIIDEKTRTVKARVTIDNRDGLLKPGMFAVASIDSAKGAGAGKVIVVPEEAVFLDGSEKYVFVQVGDGRFVVRRVSVGSASGARIEIKEGLKEGDAVVVKGVFALKSELKKGELEAE